MRELLLHVQQVTVDVRRAKRLTPVGVKERLISAVSVISPAPGREDTGKVPRGTCGDGWKTVDAAACWGVELSISLPTKPPGTPP